MPKTSKSKCYQSASDSRRPTCRQPLTALCPSCRRALSRYLRVKAVLLDQRILRRRQAARTKRFQQQELFSDLCADHIALSQEIFLRSWPTLTWLILKFPLPFVAKIKSCQPDVVKSRQPWLPNWPRSICVILIDSKPTLHISWADRKARVNNPFPMQSFRF